MASVKSASRTIPIPPCLGGVYIRSVLIQFFLVIGMTCTKLLMVSCIEFSWAGVGVSTVLTYVSWLHIMVLAKLILPLSESLYGVQLLAIPLICRVFL